MQSNLIQNLPATKRQYKIYVILYLVMGLTMNKIGRYFEIASFLSWFQVVTCYVFYLVPASLLVRRYSPFQQYLYGLLTLAPLELLGYSLGTSYAYPNNIIDKILGERNFTLAMVVFFGVILPLGNKAVSTLEHFLFDPVRPE